MVKVIECHPADFYIRIEMFMSHLWSQEGHLAKMHQVNACTIEMIQIFEYGLGCHFKHDGLFCISVFPDSQVTGSAIQFNQTNNSPHMSSM